MCFYSQLVLVWPQLPLSVGPCCPTQLSALCLHCAQLFLWIFALFLFFVPDCPYNSFTFWFKTFIPISKPLHRSFYSSFPFEQLNFNPTTFTLIHFSSLQSPLRRLLSTGAELSMMTSSPPPPSLFSLLLSRRASLALPLNSNLMMSLSSLITSISMELRWRMSSP
jgi:hypothetical protein